MIPVVVDSTVVRFTRTLVTTSDQVYDRYVSDLCLLCLCVVDGVNKESGKHYNSFSYFFFFFGASLTFLGHVREFH